MTDLPPVQYLDEAAKLFNFADWFSAKQFATPSPRLIIAHARALHRIAELEAKLPKETLEQMARREADRLTDSVEELLGFEKGFLRAAEMAGKGELPDE